MAGAAALLGLPPLTLGYLKPGNGALFVPNSRLTMNEVAHALYRSTYHFLSGTAG